ncbi:MAG: beta/gamma crystallin family protein [Alphaproteobacteria bacterium]|jgi:hypothetical protein|nr:beta/gamma crystallin family protein [Alphaproteobacteria bacterium]
MRRAGFLMALACVVAGVANAAPAAPPAPVAPPVPVPLSITVFDQENFKGRSVKISAATPNLAMLQFEDKVASFEVAGAGDWVLCENRNYGGRCARVQTKGADLRIIQLFARVSSLYPVPAVAPAVPAAQK